jgi:hypothetical protein
MRYHLLLVAALTTPAWADPLHYSEAVSGDLAATAGSAFALDVGDNTVSGTTQLLLFHNGLHFDSDFDSFAFALPSNTQLESISLSFRTLAFNTSSANAEEQLCLGAALCGSAALEQFTVDYLGPSPVDVAFAGPLPPAAQPYILVTHGLGIVVADTSIAEGTGWTSAYTWTLRVAPTVAAPVPEPQTWAMWLLGIGALSCAARAGGSPWRKRSVTRPGLRGGFLHHQVRAARALLTRLGARV